MAVLHPDFPQIVLSFSYRGWQLEIEQSSLTEQTIFGVWAHHGTSCAVAVPCAYSRPEAIRRAKQDFDVPNRMLINAGAIARLNR